MHLVFPDQVQVSTNVADGGIEEGGKLDLVLVWRKLDLVWPKLDLVSMKLDLVSMKAGPARIHLNN